MSHFEEDSNEQVIKITNNSDFLSFTTTEEVSTDPFKIDLEEIKKVRGLGASFRRKIGREFTKSFTGQDGSGTQQNLMAQAVTGRRY